MSFFLGIDGGGSKTECALADESGALLARAAGPGGNLQIISAEWLRRHLQEALEMLRRSATLDHLRPEVVCAGFAGASDAKARRMAEEILKELLQPRFLYVVGDMEVALEAAVGAGPGVVLIAGTGSISYGRNELDQEARAGGLGIRFSGGREVKVDEGGGLDIGLRALRAIGSPLLFWRFWTPLGRRMKKVFQGGGEGGGMIEAARLVPLVVEAARENDTRARRILEGAADALAELAVEVLRQLDLLSAEVLVATSGGVFKESPEVFAQVQQRILQAAPQARVEPLRVSPAEGAVRLAQRLWLQERASASR